MQSFCFLLALILALTDAIALLGLSIYLGAIEKKVGHSTLAGLLSILYSLGAVWLCVG